MKDPAPPWRGFRFLNPPPPNSTNAPLPDTSSPGYQRGKRGRIPIVSNIRENCALTPIFLLFLVHLKSKLGSDTIYF